MIPVSAIKSTEGKHLRIGSSEYIIKLGHKETSGHITVIRATIPPNTKVSPPCEHFTCDELIYVVHGSIIVYTRGMYDESQSDFTGHSLYNGDLIFIPMGTVEHFETGPDTTEILCLFTPSGQAEKFFTILSQRELESMNTIADDSMFRVLHTRM